MSVKLCKHSKILHSLNQYQNKEEYANALIVFIDFIKSRDLTLQDGVPQGLVLDSIFYLIYINNLGNLENNCMQELFSLPFC